MWSCKVAFQQRSINHSAAAAPKSFIGELWLKNKGISYQEKGCTSIVSRVILVHPFPYLIQRNPWFWLLMSLRAWSEQMIDQRMAGLSFRVPFMKVWENIATEKKPLDLWRAAKDLQGRGKHWIIDVPPRLSCPSGRIPLPNRMKFWKNSKRPLTPLPPHHFWKIILQIFIIDMVAYMQGGMRAI